MMNRRVVVHSDHRPIPEGMNRPMKQKNMPKTRPNIIKSWRGGLNRQRRQLVDAENADLLMWRDEHINFRLLIWQQQELDGDNRAVVMVTSGW